MQLFCFRGYRIISFKGLDYPKEVVLYAVYLAIRSSLSYRDIEAIMNDRGVSVDHSTINRWVVDKYGDTLGFMLSKERDEAAATAFFRQAIDNNGLPEKGVIDKSGVNYAGLENINILFMLAGFFDLIERLQVKYLNNWIEQDQRFIKKVTRPMLGFKSVDSARATLVGIETAHMIRNRQLFGKGKGMPTFQQFAALAA
jgi:putative transposase